MSTLAHQPPVMMGELGGGEDVELDEALFSGKIVLEECAIGFHSSVGNDQPDV